MKTPTLAFSAPLKLSWAASIVEMCNSFIGGSSTYLDTYGHSDEYTYIVNDGTAVANHNYNDAGIRYYTGMKCQLLRFSGSGVGGPVMMYSIFRNT